MSTGLFRRLLPAAATACAAAIVIACGSGTPTQPSSVSGASGAVAGTASVTTPQPLQPADAAQIQDANQPVTLVIKNAAVTGSGATTYTFEVATDSAFSQVVQTKADVAEGSGGQTSVALATLNANATYYWHAQAKQSGTSSPFGKARSFKVGPDITLGAPVPLDPLTGAQTTARPTFTIQDAARTGPAGAITYQFDIATDSGFSSIVSTGTVAESPGQTTFTPPVDLGANQTYYWRATAIDRSNSISGNPSATQSFTTSQVIDLSKVIVSYTDAPSDIASWKQTATIEAVEQDGSAAANGIMCISFSLSDYWPSVGFFGDDSVPVYANQWYFANIGGQWYGGPGEYLRSDRSSVCKTGQGTNSIGPDGGWTGPMRSWAPKVGELVGYMISTPARNYSGMHTINERSNIVIQPWRDTSQGSTLRLRKP
ncbi:MAG TPA: hypothetical protein VIC33_03460 [Vicinamibacterales bacterium]|jgi:hypothetical protein